MGRILRYVSAGLKAIGAAGRPGRTVYIEVFGQTEAPNVPSRTDAEAMSSDWEAVGSDLRRAMDEISNEEELEEAQDTA